MVLENMHMYLYIRQKSPKFGVIFSGEMLPFINMFI